MPISFDTIPGELLPQKSWVMWSYESRGGKWTKPLLQVSGKFASSTDPKTWCNYSQTVTAYASGHFDGVGYVFTANDSYVGIDWDDCREPDTGEVQEDISNHIRALNTYTEVSPSGCGFKSICRAKLLRGGHHNDQIGVFEKGRYFCLTGNVFPEVSAKIESRQPELNAIVKQYWPNDFTKKESHSFTTFNHNLCDSDIIQKALDSNDSKFTRLWSGDIGGYDSHSEADEALCCKLAFWTGKDAAVMDNLFRQSGLMRGKWNRQDYRNKTIENAIDFTQETYRTRIRLTQNRKPNYEKFKNFFD